MRTGLVIAGAVAALLAGAANASVSILGNSYAKGCFEAAANKQAGRAGLLLCDKALEDDSLSLVDRAATLVNRGIVEMQARHLEAALASYEEAIRIRPETAEAYVNKGIALLHSGRDAEAAAALTEGLERNPSRPEVAFYTRGVAHEMLGDARAAYEDYSRAAQLAPDWSEPAEQLLRFRTVHQKSAAG